MSARSDRSTWCPRLLVAVWVALVLALATTAPARAQEQQDEVVNRQLAYAAALSQYQAAVDAWRVVEKQWNDALEDHEQGRRAGDDDRRNAALTRALDVTRELDLNERRVTNQRNTLDRARTALLVALDDRVEQVEGQFASARTTGERASLAALLRDLENRREEVEATLEETAPRIQLAYYRTIDFDPRDTPETMVAKAELLRDRAAQADSSLAQLDRDIAGLEDRVRRNQNVQSLVTGLGRFGDVEPPVGAPGRRDPPDLSARADSTGVARPRLTIEQRLQDLRLLRVQMQDAKRQFIERAGLFEERARRIG